LGKFDHVKEEIIGLYAEIHLHLLLDKIVDKVKGFLDCEEASIFIYNPDSKDLSFEIATGEKGKQLKEIHLGRGEGVAGWIAEHRKPLIVDDCSCDPRFAPSADQKTRFVTRSILGVPVAMDDNLIGVLEAINKKKGKFAETDREVLEFIANFAAIPLQNAILFRKVLQESNEKEQLIQLGKTLSSSLEYSDIFANLRKIIGAILRPTAIRVYVQSEQTIHDLLSGAVLHAEPPAEVGIGENSNHFPLQTGKKSLGYLEIGAVDPIPDSTISLFRGLGAFLAIAIEKFELYRQMVEKEKMSRELQIARGIQQSFLVPQGFTFPGLDIAYLNLSSSEVGGDYFDVLPLGERRIIFCINDVSGHGIPASLLMAIFRTNFVYRIRKDRDIRVTLSHLNNLISETTDSSMFVTSFTALMDLDRREIVYINAGHPPPLVVRSGRTLELGEHSLVIGLFPDVDYPACTVELMSGDLIFFYTDGLIEAENIQGEPFGTKRLGNFLVDHAQDPVEKIKGDLIGQVRAFVGRDHFEDDVTVILVKID
jgi:serine phosphatase RsbU (regulator of sigma subunit)/putative methionine-R-sulfoxide reductase with GAF domain